jgi:Tol biopolymer transport system component
MKCEQVREQLSAYLDSQLAREEREEIAIHLQTCMGCSAAIVDLRRFDILIGRLPRVSPDDSLREKIFSSAEYRELTGTFGISTLPDQPTAPCQRINRRPGSRRARPYLVALPTTAPQSSLPDPRRSAHAWRFRPSRSYFTRLLVSMLLLLALSLGAFISWRFWPQQPSLAANAHLLLPSTSGLPAGVRFVFQRGSTLWSAADNATGEAIQLTLPNTTVAEDWAVRPALPGRKAGNMLAYIDLQDAHVHLIGSDGLHDKALPQPLLKPGVSPGSVWDTDTGAAILHSLAWSDDGAMLAFVADPQGTGQTALYIYALNSDSLQVVPLPQPGKATHPVWSPDSVRIAFAFQQGEQSGILDYNVKNQGILTITPNVKTPAHPDDAVLALAWSPDLDEPALTWSVGSPGNIHSLWWQRVGVELNESPRLLTEGIYQQATYNASSYQKNGGWLLVAAEDGRAADLTIVNLAAEAVQLTQNKHTELAMWSPDGSAICYIEITANDATDTTSSNRIGNLHVVEIASGTDVLVSTDVVNTPAPAWALDSTRLAYSTNEALLTVTRKMLKTSQLLPVQGITSKFTWSISPSNRLLLAINEGETGIYQINIDDNTARRVDSKPANGPFVWTQIL